jgi:uncharacterized membrane protein YjgN (DUF898 family)
MPIYGRVARPAPNGGSARVVRGLVDHSAHRPTAADFTFGKDRFAFDQCRARLYTGIARHAVLVMAALAICAVTAARLKDRADTQCPGTTPVRPGQPPAGPA